MKEEAVCFGQNSSLVGIITDPPESARNPALPALLLLNAGWMHRVSPNRIYVKMARALAAVGYVVFRFDFSGIGDSGVRYDHLSFNKSAVSETQEAMTYLTETRGVKAFLLGGICSGARISLHTACNDPRVKGVMAINTGGDFGDGLGRYGVDRQTVRQQWKRALRPRTWLDLSGRANYPRLLRMLRLQMKWVVSRGNEQDPITDDIVPSIRLLARRGVFLLLIYSEWDERFDRIKVFGDGILESTSLGSLEVEVFPETDHTFSLLGNQQRLLQRVKTWVEGLRQG